ncbi:MAG: hypothetical protein IPI67_36065 [Myxococcales bacterium]|nr:hypothetical protein [Myxococcales bacterium]
MSEDSVSRRSVLGWAGVSAAGASLAGAANAAERPPVGAGAEAPPATHLVAPLRVGSSLGAWTIANLVGVTDGALSVILSDRAGIEFQLDICARDHSSSAPRGPAATEFFEVFLANRGDGATGTHEDHGLAAMALAEVIRSNEAAADRSEFLTLAERTSPRRHVR